MEIAGARGTVTVAVSGGFDPVHVGHLRLIRAAAGLGDRLVVILNSDSFLLRKKGFVFMPQEERKEILEGLKGVDEVVVSIDDDDTVSRTLRLVRPQIFANGGDREPGDPREIEVCRSIGCRDVYGVGGGKIQSSSELVGRVRC